MASKAVSRYQAPELQQNAENLDVVEFLRCDIWALGLLCWETVCGGQPYYLTPDVEALKSQVLSLYSAKANDDTRSVQASDQGDSFALCPVLAEFAIRSIDRLQDQLFSSFRLQI